MNTSVESAAGLIRETYQPYLSSSKEKWIGLIEKGDDPKLVAKTILRVIQSKSPRIRYLVGKEKWIPPIKHIVPESFFESMERRYWKLDG